MKKALVKGGSLWYCPYSKARLVTLVMAQKYFGVDGAREIWVRSEYSTEHSEYDCPSCTKPMMTVMEPSWLGGDQINVCRRCHLIWAKPGENLQIPPPEDLIIPGGDSTLHKQIGDDLVQLAMSKQKMEDDKKKIFGEGPEGIIQSIPAFFGMPVEMSGRAGPTRFWATLLIAVITFLIYPFWISGNGGIFAEYGFYPDHPFKNGGLNVFIYPFLHANLFHLVTNLYFFLIFSDDVEEELGQMKFLIFVFGSVLVSTVVTALLAPSQNIPHVGLSGLVMAVLVFYALQFPNARIAYLILGAHTIFPAPGVVSWLNVLRWVRLPIWVVTLSYVGKDLFYYFFFEREGGTGISHSGHLGGVLAGILLWFLLAKKKKTALAIPQL